MERAASTRSPGGGPPGDGPAFSEPRRRDPAGIPTTKRVPPSASGSHAARAAHRPGELVHDREPDPGPDLAARRAAGRCRAARRPARARRRGCRARRRRPAPRPVAVARSTPTRTVPRRVLQRVLDEVGDDLGEPLGIGVDRDRRAGVRARAVTPHSRADGRNPATVSPTTRRASIGRGVSENWCASSRARSSRSATSRSRRRASVSMMRADADPQLGVGRRCRRRSPRRSP